MCYFASFCKIQMILKNSCSTFSMVLRRVGLLRGLDVNVTVLWSDQDLYQDAAAKKTVLILRHLASSCFILRHLESSCVILRHLASSCVILCHLPSSCVILRNLASSCVILHHLAFSRRFGQNRKLFCGRQATSSCRTCHRCPKENDKTRKLKIVIFFLHWNRIFRKTLVLIIKFISTLRTVILSFKVHTKYKICPTEKLQIL